MSVTLMDGGMGQELLRRSPDAPTPLWSARVMRDHPDLVLDLHRDFIAAGARIIIVNAYSVSRTRLRRYGAEEEFENLQRAAVDLANRARDASGEEVTIAGCLSPLEWSYLTTAPGTPEEIAELYAEAARIQGPGVDVMLCETMASADEGRGAAMGAAAGGRPVWVSWTVDDADGTRLRSGETLAEANAALEGLDVAARLVNCSTPEAVAQAIPELAAIGGPFGAYANGFTAIPGEFVPGETADMIGTRRDLGPEAYADHAVGWVRAGAGIVGGCCDIGPAHIAEIARRLAEEVEPA